MRLRFGFYTVLIALVFFLTGVLSGHYYAYYQWEQLHDEEQKEVVTKHDDPAEIEEAGDDNDLLKKQEAVQEQGNTNFFSQLGQTLGGSPR